MTRVSIIEGKYSEIDIKRLLKPFGGMGRFISEGDKVLLKVNLLSASEPEKAVTTHPEFVRAVIREVKKAGGIPFIGDSPAGRFNKGALDKAYKKTGIQKVAEEEGISLNFNTGVKKMNFPESIRLNRSAVCNYALGADTIIALPKLKTHSFQYLTLACKVMYGIIPGLTKAKYHAMFPGKSAFADVLLDVYLFLKPQLFIMDGILAMEGQGPGQGGDPVELGLVLASSDPVAMDITLCRMLDLEPVDIPVLKRAKIRDMWPDRIEYPIMNPGNKIKRFKLPNTADHLTDGDKMSRKRPVITERCVGCGDCVSICPNGAVKIVDDMARVTYSNCIRCFCCHEVCPENAIVLRKAKM